MKGDVECGLKWLGFWIFLGLWAVSCEPKTEIVEDQVIVETKSGATFQIPPNKEE